LCSVCVFLFLRLVFLCCVLGGLSLVSFFILVFCSVFVSSGGDFPPWCSFLLSLWLRAIFRTPRDWGGNVKGV
jgi:hypothetical protein